MPAYLYHANLNKLNEEQYYNGTSGDHEAHRHILVCNEVQ